MLTNSDASTDMPRQMDFERIPTAGGSQVSRMREEKEETTGTLEGEKEKANKIKSRKKDERKDSEDSFISVFQTLQIMLLFRSHFSRAHCLLKVKS